MKKIIIHIYLVFSIGLLSMSLHGQNLRGDSLQAASIRIHSLSLTSSWYQPEMDYFNNNLLPYLNVTDQFGSNFSLGTHLTLSLPKDFRLRLGFSYWKDKITGDEASGLRELQIELFRYRIGGIYAPENFAFAGFQPYLGVEGQFYTIKNKLAMDANDPTQKGKDFSFAPLLGIEHSFGHFVTSLEALMNVGSYYQDISDNISLARKQVSINGPEIQFSVGYKF